MTDSAIKVFTVKYGVPIKDTVVRKNFYQKGRKYFPGDIKKAMWLVGGQKLKVDFSIGGEHGQYSYQLRIQDSKLSWKFKTSTLVGRILSP